MRKIISSLPFSKPPLNHMPKTHHQAPVRSLEDKDQNLAAVEEGLLHIYAAPDGEMPDLTKMDIRPRSALRRFLLWTIGLLLIISAVAWGGFFLWTQGVFTSHDTLAASITGPTAWEVGEEATYVITYENPGQTPLEIGRAHV